MIMRGVSRAAFAAPLLLVGLLLAPVARAAIELEPGTWQDTETGVENGKPAKTEVTTDCMTAEDAKDPVKSLSKMQAEGAGQCQTMDVKQTGNVVSLNMKCGDAKQTTVELVGTFTFIDRKHYQTSMKSTISFGGRTMTADKQVDSKWLSAACKKK
ncbi:MAG TPA: DUF3617 family protein [Pseudolabrys sp.]|nr:DUF3617 family protein [Pseudolabrys sp.]